MKREHKSSTVTDDNRFGMQMVGTLRSISKNFNNLG